MAFASESYTQDAGLRGRFAALTKEISERLARRRVYQQTLRELSALSNRDLTDLGLHRSMITQVAHEAAYGK